MNRAPCEALQRNCRLHFQPQCDLHRVVQEEIQRLKDVLCSNNRLNTLGRLAVSWILDYLPTGSNLLSTTTFCLPIQHRHLDPTPAPTATDFCQSRLLAKTGSINVPIKNICLTQQIDRLAQIATGGPSISVNLPTIHSPSLEQAQTLPDAQYFYTRTIHTCSLSSGLES